MNILPISDFFAELFADGGLYLCLLGAMGVIAVLFIIIALLVPRKVIKKEGKIKKDGKQKKQIEEQSEQAVEIQPDETIKDVYDDEQVPTVRQVLGETADEFDDDEPVMGGDPLSAGSGRTDPVLTFEQIISEAIEEPADRAQEKKRSADKPKG